MHNKELIFKEGYKLKLNESVIKLEANNQSKPFANLILNKLEIPSSNENAKNLLCLENSEIKIIFEIKPS